MTAVAGIVLAGGAARRFGRDKLAIDMGGRTLLETAIEAIAAVVDVLIVAVAAEAPEPNLTVPDGVELRVVRDRAPHGGPLAGLVAGLEGAADLGADRAIVVGGDMPWLRPAVLRALLGALEDPAVDACAPIVEEARRPLPMALRVAPGLAAAAARLDAGRRGLVGPLDDLRTVELAEAAWRPLDPEGLTFRDIDRPADLVRDEPEAPGRAETGDLVR